MKILVSILLGLLVVGCGKKESTSTSGKVSKTASAIEPTWETSLPTEPYIAKRNLKSEDVIGIYEKQVEEGNIFRIVFLKEGSMEFHSKGEKLDEDSVLGSSKWRIEGSEIRTSNKDGLVESIYTIENNGDLTRSGLFGVLNGRINYSKDELDTYNRIKDTKPTSETKEPPANAAKELTPEDVVGTYELELKKFGETQRYVLLDNSTVEYYLNGKKEEAEHKWSIVDKEVHIERENRAVSVFSINKDESITGIATIDEGGKRKEILKEHQYTRKKIK